MVVRKWHLKIYQKAIVVLEKKLGVLLKEGDSNTNVKQNCKSHSRIGIFISTIGLESIFTIATKWKLQYMSFYPREDMVDQANSISGYMMMQMVVAQGGLCAETVVFCYYYYFDFCSMETNFILCVLML
uniref:ATP-dependent zinc metalloprotease FTSH 12, chloroplastic-like n=1 Tax=Erigeron canadensis TaxID=72917 RepID=UPI001CB88FD9|nr:ATP-dependent zinc metalloprotease FTSH 12, chloroplastic-like [Erigeron canadensis]XP_043628797.1 ATP-dependent zinc metalloprotease FTSH 12, chloroplastic-like [Erigeron canadensis]